jgi:hypothetical protein
MKTLICIDPGKSGGLVCKSDGQPVLAVAMPETEGDVLALLREWATDPANTVAVIEEVSGFAGVGQPGSGMFKFGRGFGFLLGALQTLGVRVELVRPQKWQKAMGLGSAVNCASKVEWKNKLKAHAQRLHPGLKVTLAVGDALLILEYAIAQMSLGSP